MSEWFVSPDEDPRTYANPQGELATYREYLTNYRLTIGLKCDGLDPEQLARRSVPPSTLSLLGLIRHLAAVENNWFQRILPEQEARPRIYAKDDDPDWDFNGAVADQAVVDDAFATWRKQIAMADEWLDGLSEDDLGREVANRGEPASIRDILVHLIEEYARHAGHADLLRESIDGRIGQ